MHLLHSYSGLSNHETWRSHFLITDTTSKYRLILSLPKYFMILLKTLLRKEYFVSGFWSMRFFISFCIFYNCISYGFGWLVGKPINWLPRNRLVGWLVACADHSQIPLQKCLYDHLLLRTDRENILTLFILKRFLS